MKTPNFFILGAQKSGTTYLAHVLSEHPDVYFSDPKETMFFSRNRPVPMVQADYETYCETYFGDAKDQKWRGEGSTTYLQWVDARDRLKQFVTGKPKFIVCLRQPTAKAISFFIHNWRRDRYQPDSTLHEITEAEFQFSPYQTSIYADGISRWLEVFPREDFLFMKFDDLEQGGDVFVKKATDFLGITEARNPAPTKVNAGLPLVWEDGGLTVDPSAAKDRVRPSFSLQELEQLHARFMPDLSRTEELTGLDLSSWYDLPQFAAANE